MPEKISRRDFLKGITGISAAYSSLLLMASPIFAVQKYTKENDDGEHFVFLRVKYRGGDWYTDVDIGRLYGSHTDISQSDIQLSRKLQQYTNIPVEIDGNEAQYITLDDPEIFSYPFLYITGHGELYLSDTEQSMLREYLERGGFMLADDCLGFDYAFRREIAKVFPDNPLKPIPVDHPVYRSFFQLRMPGNWDNYSGHDTYSPLFDTTIKYNYRSRRGLQSNAVWGGDKQVRPWHEGIFIDDRLALLYTMNDLGCAWEGHPCYPYGEAQREWAFKMGINIIVYALTH
ncbi:TPA: DUF4159 domain-containing protein [Candidatus Poribacteria bacterium]|nr:DUF4159 domain-containing protein [Candidatus Poribacteria bacterium]